MTWEQRYRLKQYARTSLALWAGLSLAAALVAAPVVRLLDSYTNWSLFNYSQEGARAVLSALVGSMLTFIVFVLSATLIVVQLAAGQLTPRVIGIVFAMPRVKLTLGLYTFTYTYTLAALGRVEERVPDLHVSLAVILNLLCIVAFFLFVQHLADKLRPTSLMRFVADQGMRVIELVYPKSFDPDRIDTERHDAALFKSAQQVEFTGRSGMVMAFSVAELVKHGTDTNATIELVPQVGDFISQGDPLFRIAPAGGAVHANRLRASVAVGAERTLDQDPRFVFRILVDIASRALSPAINDPTTAVQAIDQIHHLLLSVGRRNLGDGQVRDRAGTVRLLFGTPDWADYVMLAVSEIRQYGQASLQVNRRLRAMLEHLIEVLPQARRPPLCEELALLGIGVERSFKDEEDRKRAATGDYQGMGGSDT